MLKVDNLTFEVNEEGRKRCLVNHISFEVKDGEMLVITGPNGGGKSTLAKVLAYFRAVLNYFPEKVRCVKKSFNMRER